MLLHLQNAIISFLDESSEALSGRSASFRSHFLDENALTEEVLRLGCTSSGAGSNAGYRSASFMPPFFSGGPARMAFHTTLAS